MRAAPGEVSELGDDLLHESRKDELEVLGYRMSFRLHDLHLFADAQRVVSAHLGAEAILQWRDDPSARRVVLGVRARDHEQVERQADSIAPDLHILLFHDVQQADLDALGEVGQLVDAEDPAVGARQEAVVDGQLVGEVAALRDLDRVDLADEVRDRDVGGGQLFAVAGLAADPADLDRVAVPLDQVEAAPADGTEGMIVDLAARDHGHEFVQQAHERAHDPALRLAALAEHDDVVAGDDRVGELGQDRVVVAHDAGEQLLAGAEAGQEVAAHLLLDRFALVPAGAQLGDRLRSRRGHPCTIDKPFRKLD